MATLQVQNLCLAFGDRDILDDVSFILTDISRTALCGGNGSGKSTLLKVVSGLMSSDSMQLSMTKGLTLAYLPQSDIVPEGQNVYAEVEKGYEHFGKLLEEKSFLEQKLANLGEQDKTQHLLLRLHEIEEELLSSGYYNRKEKIEQVLLGLGFSVEDLHRDCKEFSGGWQMRIALARVLVENATIMMLDEPTNYLDIEALVWLKNFLKLYHGGVLIVSHDQGFLDDTVNEVFELFQGKLTRYSGNYSQYQTQREMEIQQLEASYKQQQEMLQKNEQFIERFRYKATKSKQVQSRIKQLEKIQVVEIPSHLKQLEFCFPPAPHSGNDVLIVDKLSKSFGKIEIFESLSFMVNKGDRLAVTGRNGAGKSTLLRMLVGLDADHGGTIRYGSGVTIGYFAQDTEKTLNQENTVIEELQSIATTADIPKLRTYLGSFLFCGDDVFKSVAVLSGGERSRLALLKILLHPVNLLILDEPTNHLDINAKQMLLDALRHYDGTMVFVSHDTYFISHIANRILYLSSGAEPEFFEGDYSYFSYKLNEKEKYEEANSQKKEKEEATGASSYKQNNKIRNRIVSLQRQCDQILKENGLLQNKIEALEAKMADPSVYSDIKKIT
ncbi:MAG: ABC-F family ATP-binding cassette domain-containing protein, partial [Sphaerochaetaceae bacterium]